MDKRNVLVIEERKKGKLLNENLKASGPKKIQFKNSIFLMVVLQQHHTIIITHNNEHTVL